MKKTKIKYLTLCILALIFLCPGFAALIFYEHPQWLAAAGTNKGHLLNPPEHVYLPDSNKWKMVFWSPLDCKQACSQTLDKLARVRLSLGRRLYHVDEVLLMEKTGGLSEKLSARLLDEDIRVAVVSEKQAQSRLNESPAIFLVSPRNEIILEYPVDAKPGDIFYDVNHLLRQSGKDNG